jgi:hypothetical protein
VSEKKTMEVQAFYDCLRLLYYEGRTDDTGCFVSYLSPQTVTPSMYIRCVALTFPSLSAVLSSQYLLYIYLFNIWSSHVRQKFLNFFILIREKKKEKLPTNAIIKKLD